MVTSITALSPDACSGLQGIAFDVDDTLTRHGRLEEVAFQALWRLHEHHIKLIAVTGRPWGYAHVLAQHWPIDAAVGENGACWTARLGDALVEGGLATEDNRHQDTFRVIQQRVQASLPHVRVSRDHGLRRYDLAFDVGEYVSLPEADVQRLVSIIEEGGAQAVRSTVHVHAQLGSWDKAQGVCDAAKQVLGVDVAAEKSRWLFIGDSPNDAAAFAFFPQSVGVANIQPFLGSLPVPPRYITQADHGQGFSECAQIVLRHRPTKA